VMLQNFLHFSREKVGAEISMGIEKEYGRKRGKISKVTGI